MQIVKIFFLSIILFLSFCKNKNENNIIVDGKNKRKIELIERIKQRTESDLKRYGIKKLLLSKKGGWDYNFVMSVEFINDGKAFLIINGKKDGFFYWKVENDNLYINPNKAIYPFDENKFLLTTIKSAEISTSLEVSIIERCKYSILIESKNKKLDFQINFFTKKININ